MTTEERFDRIEHLAAGMAEERRRDREEYKALRRDTERHINELAVDTRLRFEQVADQIGVDETTIVNWERNATAPAVRHIPAIIRFLGYDPLPPPNAYPERLATARRALGLSQRKMAERLGLDPATIKNWETGRHQPTGKSMELIGRILQSW